MSHVLTKRNSVSYIHVSIATTNFIATKRVPLTVKTGISENYKITSLNLRCQFLDIKMQSGEYGPGTNISLGCKILTTTILKQFNLQKSSHLLTPMNPIMKLHLAENEREKELKVVKGY